MCITACVEARGQFRGIRSFLPPCGSLESNSNHQAWWQVPLSVKPSRPSCDICISLSFALCLSRSELRSLCWQPGLWPCYWSCKGLNFSDCQTSVSGTKRPRKQLKVEDLFWLFQRFQFMALFQSCLLELVFHSGQVPECPPPCASSSCYHFGPSGFPRSPQSSPAFRAVFLSKRHTQRCASLVCWEPLSRSKLRERLTRTVEGWHASHSCCQEAVAGRSQVPGCIAKTYQTTRNSWKTQPSGTLL